MGGVHDFISLSGSMRHEGKSIGYIIGEYVGERGKDMLLWFAFLTIILVVAVVRARRRYRSERLPVGGDRELRIHRARVRLRRLPLPA